MARVRNWWDSLTPQGKALIVASAGTGALLGGLALRKAIEPKSKSKSKSLPKLKCGKGRSKGMLYGCDVSHWQKQIDWDKVCNDGLAFAIIKATQDSHIIDSRYRENWEGAGRVGLYRGAYCFAVPQNDDGKHKSQLDPRGGPEEQAEFFFETVGKLDGPFDLPPVLDLEWRGNNVAETADFCRRWLIRAEELFKRVPAIYTTTNFVKNAMGRPEWIKRYIFWQAYWTPEAEPPSKIEGFPWTFWQYSNKGSVQGITTGVDLNRFFGSPEELRKLAQGKVLPPRPASGVGV